MIISPGSTSISVTCLLVDDSGLPITGRVAATFPSVYYARSREAKVAIPLHDLTTIADAWYGTGGNYGLFEVGGGRYRLDVPNAAFATFTIDLDIFAEASGLHLTMLDAIQIMDLTCGGFSAGALSQLSGLDVTFSAPSLAQGVIDPPVIRNRDYFAVDNAAIDIVITGAVDFTGATCYLTATPQTTGAHSATEAFRWAGSIVNPGTASQTLRFQPTKTETAHLEATYEAQCVVTLADGHVISPARIFELPLVGKDDASA